MQYESRIDRSMKCLTRSIEQQTSAHRRDNTQQEIIERTEICTICAIDSQFFSIFCSIFSLLLMCLSSSIICDLLLLLLLILFHKFFVRNRWIVSMLVMHISIAFIRKVAFQWKSGSVHWYATLLLMMKLLLLLLLLLKITANFVQEQTNWRRVERRETISNCRLSVSIH